MLWKTYLLHWFQTQQYPFHTCWSPQSCTFPCLSSLGFDAWISFCWVCFPPISRCYPWWVCCSQSRWFLEGVHPELWRRRVDSLLRGFSCSSEWICRSWAPLEWLKKRNINYCVRIKMLVSIGNHNVLSSKGIFIATLRVTINRLVVSNLQQNTL